MPNPTKTTSPDAVRRPPSSPTLKRASAPLEKMIGSPLSGVQADIFDHLIAILPEFGLRLFQQPSGLDLARLGAVAPTEQAAA